VSGGVGWVSRAEKLRNGLQIRAFSPDDDLEAELDLKRRAFGPVPTADAPSWLGGVRRSADAGQLFGVFDGRRPVASARYFPMRQWWHGRPVPMAGVAGVKVAPEERGKGIGRALMTRLIAEISGNGYPLSVLYPATAPLYRSLGWELVGGRYETALPAAALATLLPPDSLAERTPGGAEGNAGSAADGAAAVRRVTAADAAAVVATLDGVHRFLRECGPATHQPDIVADWLDDDHLFGYLANDGFLAYRWANGTELVRVDLLAAASAQTARRFWDIVASHASMARTVQASLAPDDPIRALTREPVAVTRQVDSWMVRVFDPVAAIEARGYPSAATVSVQLDLADETMPACAGRWMLEVSGGRGSLTAVPSTGGGTALRLGARGFASLFAGVPVRLLRLAGQAAGGEPATDEQLDGAFGGRPPFMLFNF
jgi:predicted acetyltransferase